MRRLVLDLRDRRPIWALPPEGAAAIREALPGGWEVVEPGTWADGSGDGGWGVAPELLEAVRRAEVYIGYGVPEEVLLAGFDTLRWVHTGTAGVGGSLHRAMRESGVLFSNSAGTHGPPIAETVLAMLLHFARGLDHAARGQREGRWAPEPFFRADAPVRELSRMHVGIFGYGGIGREVGRRLRALGARVTGVRRGGADGGDEARGAGEPGGGAARGGDGTGRSGGGGPIGESDEGVRIMRGMSALDALLPELDALVLSAPATPETEGVLDRARIGRLPPGAVVVNVARGSLLDQDALVEALAGGRLRGAGLDVFTPEPLPEGHPLWSLPNVLITPHVSGVTHHFWEREIGLILENLGRYLAGRPLVNRVDREAGY